jgi:hypothetical protein
MFVGIEAGPAVSLYFSEQLWDLITARTTIIAACQKH